MDVKLLGPSSLRPRRGVVTRGSVGEAVWFTVCRVQAEETRVSDHNAQEGIENLSDRLLLHLPLSTGSSQAGAEGGGSGGEQRDLEWARLHLECCGNPRLSWVGQEGIRLPSGLSTEGLPVGIVSLGLTEGPQPVFGRGVGGVPSRAGKLRGTHGRKEARKRGWWDRLQPGQRAVVESEAAKLGLRRRNTRDRDP